MILKEGILRIFLRRATNIIYDAILLPKNTFRMISDTRKYNTTK